MKALAVSDLSKSFDGLLAVEGVDFSVEIGERLVIIGPNGAGKTTLFNLVTGDLAPSRGRIYLFGQDITRKSIHRRTRLGMARTFQLTNLFPNLTLSDAVFLAVEGTSTLKFTIHRPASSFKELLIKTERMIEQWGLREYQHALIQDLSYGVQRQLEVVMTLASGAKLLLLDEPTAGLSPSERSTLVSMILNLDPEITLVSIEHDMDVAFQVARKMIVLHYGHLLAEGSPEEIKANPRVREIYLGQQ
jgi:branched-chain amino acid transport system ATP-binding protein